MDITPNLARALIRSLTRGTAVPRGSRYIHVGNHRWLSAQQELLDEIAEDGHADTKFVRGAYGSGKSHFLSMMQETARERAWMTSHVECRADGVQIDRFETLYPRLVAKLNCQELVTTRAKDSLQAELNPCRYLLNRWLVSQLARVGVREDQSVRPMDAEHRLFEKLRTTLLETSLFSDFTRALCAYVRAYFTRDDETRSAVVRWLSGGTERLRLPAMYLRKPAIGTATSSEIIEIWPIGPGSAMEVMRGLLWLIRAAGFSGLVLCIDEVEELAKLATQKRRDQALQALREYVDHAGGEGGFQNLCLYLAATPEMFDGPEFFPRYDALATRIAPVSDEINWRATVVDLDRTPLSVDELVELGSRICAVHRIAYPDSTPAVTDDEVIRAFVDSVIRSRVGISKPRLLARVIVDSLERGRQSGTHSVMPDGASALVETTARAIRGEQHR